MQMKEKPGNKNVLIITAGLKRWQRSGLFSEFVRLLKVVQCVHYNYKGEKIIKRKFVNIKHHHSVSL